PISTRRGIEPQPSRREHPEKMCARKQKHVALHRTRSSDHAIGAGRHVGRRFASGTSVEEQLPIGTLSMDLGTRASFVLAIVPFDEIRVDFGVCSKTGETGAADCPLQRAGENTSERHCLESLTKVARI